MLGVSCDHTASSRAWATALGGLPYPRPSAWEPKGQMSRTYDLWNPERGASQRAILIIDKEGIIRYRRIDSAPHLPDMEEIVRVLQQLAASSPTGEGQRSETAAVLSRDGPVAASMIQRKKWALDFLHVSGSTNTTHEGSRLMQAQQYVRTLPMVLTVCLLATS